MLLFSWKLTTCLSNWKYVYYLKTCLPISLLLNAFYFHGDSLHVSLIGNTHIMSKPVYRFLNSEMSILSRKLNRCFSNWKYAHYLKTFLPISLLQNAFIFIEIDYMFF